MPKTQDDFLEALAQRESSGRPGIVNKYGYAGLYQMGEAALEDAGYYVKPSKRYDNSWTGQFTGKNGIHTLKDFLNNPKEQKNACINYKQKQWGYIKNKGCDKYIGDINNDVEVTRSGILGAVHLLGQENLNEYLSSHGQINPVDGNGTSLEEYMKLFGGYDVSGITGDIEPRRYTEEDLEALGLGQYFNKNRSLYRDIKSGSYFK